MNSFPFIHNSYVENGWMKFTSVPNNTVECVYKKKMNCTHGDVSTDAWKLNIRKEKGAKESEEGELKERERENYMKIIAFCLARSSIH